MADWHRGLDLEWAFDLVSPDSATRARARQVDADLNEAYRMANAPINELWGQTRTYSPADPALAARMDQLIAASQDAFQYLLCPAIHHWTSWRDARLQPYALLHLRWEARFPDEWTTSWGLKKNVLRTFATLQSYPPELTDALQQLVVDAVTRGERCEDRWYSGVARAVADDHLRSALRAVREDSTDPEHRVRAAFVEHMIDVPDAAPSFHTWHAFRRSWAASG